jgi:hypothetical protein
MTRSLPMFPMVGVALAAALFSFIAACPPPPPVEEPDAGFPDAGTVIAAGDECLSPTTINACEAGLECNTLLSAAEGTFACVQPAASGEPCFFNNDEVERAPTDDGCINGLTCGGEDTCVRVGAVGAACESPTDCETLNCGTLADGTGPVCVVNECLDGCPAGTVCQQSGSCGLRCVTAPKEDEPCVVAGADACSPVRSICEAPLECFVGDANSTFCGVPGGEGSGCNLTTLDDGCTLEFRCDSTGECVDRDNGED